MKYYILCVIVFFLLLGHALAQDIEIGDIKGFQKALEKERFSGYPKTGLLRRHRFHRRRKDQSVRLGRDVLRHVHDTVPAQR